MKPLPRKSRVKERKALDVVVSLIFHKCALLACEIPWQDGSQEGLFSKEGDA